MGKHTQTINKQPPTFDVEKLRRLALEVKEIREEYYKKKKEEKNEVEYVTQK